VGILSTACLLLDLNQGSDTICYEVKSRNSYSCVIRVRIDSEYLINRVRGYVMLVNLSKNSLLGSTTCSLHFHNLYSSLTDRLTNVRLSSDHITSQFTHYITSH
jgi:hypothetical protein